MARDYICYNGAAPTTAALVAQATGTAIRTMLQLAPPATMDADLLAWGFSFDGTAANQPVKVELVETDVAASVMTAHVAAGIVGWNQPAELASQMQLGAALTAWTPGAAVTEGATTVTRLIDYVQAPPTAPYVMQFVPGDRPKLRPSRFTRVRVTAANTVNMVCWIAWSE